MRRESHNSGASVTTLTLLATGAVVGVALVRSDAFRRAVHAVWSDRRGWLSGAMRARQEAGRDAALVELRQRLLGRDRPAVAAIFGPPRFAAHTRNAAPRSYWDADTWYYPLNEHDRVAMAVLFDRDKARQVDFVKA